MRFNVVMRQVGRAGQVPSVLGMVLQVESESPQGAVAEADAWVREHADESLPMQALLPRGVELVMEVHDPATRGRPGGA